MAAIYRAVPAMRIAGDAGLLRGRLHGALLFGIVVWMQHRQLCLVGSADIVTLLCIAPYCALPRQHVKGCDGGDCRGCLPAEAVVGCVCERCFNRQTSTMTEIGELYERLVELATGVPVVVDDRPALERIATAADGTLVQWGEPLRVHVNGCTGTWPDGTECLGCGPAPRMRDPVAATVGAGAVTHSGAPRVSGTPSPTAPISLDAFDLLAPSRPWTVSAGQSYDPYAYWAGKTRPVRICRCGWPLRQVEGHRQKPTGEHRWLDWKDQTGQPSVATALDLWVRDWSEQGAGALPAPTVPELLRWLKARWDWAAKNHPAVREFITETRALYHRLLTVLGEREPLPEPCYGIACRSCHQRNLFRRPDGTGTVDCHSCGLVLKAAEYDDYLRDLAPRSKRAHVEAKAIVAHQHEQRGGLCPVCGQPARIDEVTLANMAGVVRVVFDCKCESLMTPVVA